MKRKKFIPILSILLCLWMLSYNSCKKKEPLVVQGNIEGTVVDAETGQAVPGVNVTIVANSSTTFAEQSKITGSDGKFSFKDLEAGNYKLTFFKDGYQDNSKNISLTAGQTSSGDVTLTPVKSGLDVTPTLLDFGTSANILSVEIRNTGKGDLTWSIVEDLLWLSVNPTSGTTKSEVSVVTVTIDRSLITEDSKVGSFVINSNSGSRTVNVSVGKAGPVLEIIPTMLDFGETEAEKAINVSNAWVGTLLYTATADQLWITLENATGSVTTDTKIIKVKVVRMGLNPGNYTGNVVISSNANTITVPISMSVLQPATPNLLNGQVSGISYNSAQVSATLTSLGSSAVTQYGHCWSTSPNPTTANNKTMLGGTTELKSFTSDMTELNTNTTYYIRAYATNDVGTTYSDAISFTTLLPTAPELLNGQVSSITYNSAQVSGTLTSLGSSAVTQHGHCWSLSANPSITDNKTTLGGTNVLKSFTSSITGLNTNTTYYVKAYATNAIGTTYSDAITFTTLPPPTLPTIQTTQVQNIKHDQIDGVGNITVLGDGLVTDYGFCYSTSNTMPTTSDSKASLGQTTQTGSFTVTVTGLQGSTKYYLRAYAINSMGTAYGSTVIEATTLDVPPVVTSGLVAYYTFDNQNCNEAQGYTQYNGIQQGNGSPVWATDIPGTSGKSLQTNDDVYYQIATSPFLNYTSQWSVSIWIKINKYNLLFGHYNNSTSSYYTRIGIGISNNNNVCALISSISSNGNWYLMNSSIGTHTFNIDVSSSLLNNQWHLLTVTRTSTGVYKMYIDATLFSQFTSIRTIETPSDPMNIARYFTGKMDNFRVYNRELSQTEITTIYNAKQ